MHISTLKTFIPRFAAAMLCGLLLLATAGRAQAQQQGQQGQMPNPEAIADQMLASLDAELELTEEQKAEVRPILTDALGEQAALMQQMRQDSTASPQDVQSDMQQIQKRADERLAGVLTEEQMTKYDAMRSQQGGGDPIETAIAQLDAQLDLTDEQKTQMRPILEAQMQKVQAMMQEMQSSGEQATAKQRQQAMQEAQEIQQQTKQQIEAVLTEEQVQKLNQMQQQMQQGTPQPDSSGQ